jgi:8-oxo-dGTP pyrophosphatase MutT (NUDIX family)
MASANLPPMPRAEASPGAQPVRDAATVILVRSVGGVRHVLMGQRGHGAAFMPSKYVFPGGGVDPSDEGIPLAAPPASMLGPLDEGAAPGSGRALLAAAIRELWEEAGLMLSRPGDWPAPSIPAPWAAFAGARQIPDASGLSFVFRAITPPGRTRRYDARFFMADAVRIAGDPLDFSRATDELSHLHWVPLQDARRLNLPFVTEVVLAEVAHRLASDGSSGGVPFFDNSGPEPCFRRLGQGADGAVSGGTRDAHRSAGICPGTAEPT